VSARPLLRANALPAAVMAVVSLLAPLLVGL
jgi:hypothetical protein